MFLIQQQVLRGIFIDQLDIVAVAMRDNPHAFDVFQGGFNFLKPDVRHLVSEKKIPVFYPTLLRCEIDHISPVLGFIIGEFRSPGKMGRCLVPHFHGIEKTFKIPIHLFEDLLGRMRSAKFV